ncbi:CBS domain-containing protein [Secundilactobacillus kimchicus]|uniref:cyclic-di-AMP-binding protein CbpB n=1 Tax=Secundilactobacillus kimchicus TaxID=528209 RepID=UPI001C016749|nr:cyclic-di-AMP-binding protein CbpB [Secundilactobacillus kimchicus]MBT9671688.1 CBS domain-containing protein [Secundilactobacillus kimchicus]
MISQPIKTLLAPDISDLLIPASRVANVMTTNDGYHAFLVLTKVGYSKIVVLDQHERIQGLLSLQMLTEKMLTTDRIAPENLLKFSVASVMETDFKVLTQPIDLDSVLHDLVDAAFLPVVSNDRHFEGIITRREILKRLNYLGHHFDDFYTASQCAPLKK